MTRFSIRISTCTAVGLLMTLPLMAGAAMAQDSSEDIMVFEAPDADTVVLGTVVITAQEQVKQALGASTVNRHAKLTHLGGL